MMKSRLPDRVAHLAKWSGLDVRHFDRYGVNYFVFEDGGKTVKTVCTYPKAKLFAIGVAYGRLA